MGDGRDHQRYEDAPLFRAVITREWAPDENLYPDGVTHTIIKGQYNTPGPAKAAVNRELNEHTRYPRKGLTVSGRVQVGVTSWGDLT